MKNFSLFKQIIIINITIMAIFLAIFTIKNFFVFKNQIDSLEGEKIDSIIKTIEPIIAINLTLETPNGYIEVVNDLIQKHDEFLMVEIKDMSKNLIYVTNKKNFNKTTKDINYKTFNVAIKSVISDKYIATVRLYYTFSHKYKNVVYKYKTFLFFMFLAFLASLLTITILIKVRVKPLENLEKKMKKYNLNKKVIIKHMSGNNEISTINNATREMLIRIENEVKKRINYEKRLMHQNRLVAMGEMINNIAHQWRQPLAHISAIFLNIERSFELKKLNEEYLNKKLIEADGLISHMSQTIDDFRDFLSPSKSKKSFDITKSIEDSLNISSKLKDVDIEFLEDKSYFINGYENEFKQVILSILNNSIDIFDKRDIKEKKIFISISNDMQYLSIIIEDSGGGVDKNIIDKIFDPYFTTKHKSGGTGLGLYISKLIIEDSMNGSISVENGKFGAKFTIKFKNEDLK